MFRLRLLVQQTFKMTKQDFININPIKYFKKVYLSASQGLVLKAHLN